jgi:uncharacterized protein
MGQRTEFADGVPCWVDIGTPDTTGTARFYGELLGWEAEIDPRPEAGGYGQMLLRGSKVAGVGPQQNAEVPPYWTVYVSVSDVDATAAKVEAAGGTVLVPRMDVFDEGSMAVFLDPNGSPISAWQAGDHHGCELVNEVGTFCWNELATPDLAASTAFYGEVFGWTADGEGSGDTAAVYTVGGKVICGAHPMGEGEAPFWSVWFTVADADAAAEQTVDLGGQVFMPPTDMSFGRGTVVADPQGAVVGFGYVETPDP